MADALATRPDWIQCIEQAHGTSWCGQQITSFHFTDLDHAAQTGLVGGRLVACQQCVRAAMKALGAAATAAQPGEESLIDAAFAAYRAAQQQQDLEWSQGKRENPSGRDEYRERFRDVVRAVMKQAAAPAAPQAAAEQALSTALSHLWWLTCGGEFSAWVEAGVEMPVAAMREWEEAKEWRQRLDVAAPVAQPQPDDPAPQIEIAGAVITAYGPKISEQCAQHGLRLSEPELVDKLRASLLHAYRHGLLTTEEADRAAVRLLRLAEIRADAGPTGA